MSNWCTLGATPICNQLQLAQTHMSRPNVEASVVIQLLSCPCIVYLIWKGDMGDDCKSIFLEQNYLPEGGRLPQGLGTAFIFLKVCSFSRLSTDSFSCMTSFPSPEYKPSYNSKYVHLTTLFLFPLGSLLHHISDYLLGTYLHRNCDVSVCICSMRALACFQAEDDVPDECLCSLLVNAGNTIGQWINPFWGTFTNSGFWTCPTCGKKLKSWKDSDIVSLAVICSINMEVEWNNLVAVFGQIVEPAQHLCALFWASWR